jgi:hypothetical protein
LIHASVKLAAIGKVSNLTRILFLRVRWQEGRGIRQLRNVDRNPPDGVSTLASARFLQKKVLEDELRMACRKRRTANPAI